MPLQFDQRETLLIAEAIVLAIEVMDRLPEEHRPQRDISDLIKLQLNFVAPSGDDWAVMQEKAKRRMDLLTTKPTADILPFPPPSQQ
jgi:hypothetical protein